MSETFITLSNLQRFYTGIKNLLPFTKGITGTQTAKSNNSVVSGNYASSLGNATIADQDSQFVVGKYNCVSGSSGASDGALFTVGCGTGNGARKDAFNVCDDGSVKFGTRQQSLGNTTITQISPSGTVTGGLAALYAKTNRLIPSGATSTGNTVSVANNTNTTIASILLEKGVYILIGVGRFASNKSGYRRLYFAFDEEGNAADRYCMANVAPVSGAVTIPQVVWLQTITADDTYVYLRALQTSGTSLNVTYAGIQVIRISDCDIT